MKSARKKSRATAPATRTGQPVPGFPLSFTWSVGDWERIFDAQIDLLKEDVARAKAEDAARRAKNATPAMKDGDVGDQIAAYFDGIQVDPASSEAGLSRGYAT